MGSRPMPFTLWFGLQPTPYPSSPPGHTGRAACQVWKPSTVRQRPSGRVPSNTTGSTWRPFWVHPSPSSEPAPLLLRSLLGHTTFSTSYRFLARSLSNDRAPVQDQSRSTVERFASQMTSAHRVRRARASGRWIHGLRMYLQAVSRRRNWVRVQRSKLIVKKLHPRYMIRSSGYDVPPDPFTDRFDSGRVTLGVTSSRKLQGKLCRCKPWP